MLCFEEAGKYTVPKDNYLWNVDARVSDIALYNRSHRGDKFIVVVRKSNGKIASVYHTDYFEYKA